MRPCRLPPQLLGVVRSPDLRARLRVRRDLPGFLRVHFLAAASDSGVLGALGRPATVDEVAARAGVVRRDLLERLLELGVTLGELRRTNGRYRLRGSAARALARAEGDPLVAVLQELSEYHSRVYNDLPRLLVGEPEPDYLAGRRELIARSSLALEPALTELVRALVADRGAARLLDVGCGSGVYLRRAAEANGLLGAVGVDVAPEVVEQTRRDVETWGLADRVTVVIGDARALPSEADGPFDVVLLFNNVYYFAEEERIQVFRELRARLREEGVLAVATMLRGSTPTAVDFDIVLGATAGCTLLPTELALADELRQAGLQVSQRVALVPREPLAALLAAP